MGATPLTYTRAGAGSPVVLLHGLAFRRGPWRPVFQELAQHHDVIAFDLPVPAAGQSAKGGMTTLVDAVRDSCRALELDRPHIVGNSFGGAVALELGVRGIAASVTAVAPLGFGRHYSRALLWSLARSARLAARIPEPARMAVADTRPARALARRVFRGDHTAESARRVRFDARLLSANAPLVVLAPMVAGYRFVPRPIRCPVTILWGDRDRLLPYGDSRRARRRIPHARMVTLLGCGHIPMAENPQAVTREILHTCREAEPESIPPGTGAA